MASLGCVALVWACATRLGRPALPATLFFGLNPVLLAYAVGGAHNDLLMLVAALGGIYLLLGGRQSADGGAGRRSGREELLGRAAALRPARLAGGR